MVKQTEYRAPIGGGKFIEFTSADDWLIFTALTAPFEVFAQIYTSATGLQTTREHYDSFQTADYKARFNRIIWNTKLSTGLPLWKALILKRGKV